MAKAEALEAVMEDESEDRSSNIGLQIQDPAEHTKEYVEEQAKHAAHQSTPVLEGASILTVLASQKLLYNVHPKLLHKLTIRIINLVMTIILSSMLPWLQIK